MKKFAIVTAAVVAAVALLVLLTLPPRSLALANRSDDGTIRGILHVHTNRSDGLSSPDEVAAAAGRAGLKFVVFTDHGDATRKPEAPSYRSGVLCLDGVEISTTGGHYIALDMPPAPYPLGGEARDVVEDVKRLGGFGIAAHPDSPKPQLRWREWATPFDGMELLNLDTGWRVLREQSGRRPKWQLFVALIDYPFRSPEIIASLIQPTTALYNWEALTRRRRVVSLAGADAHARLELRNTNSDVSSYALALPGYESSFRVMSVHVRTDRPLSGDAGADSTSVVRAIRAGHLYAAVDAVASPPLLEFTATNSRGMAEQGDELGVGGPVLLHVRSNAPPQFTTIVHDGTATVASSRDADDLTVHASDRPAVYWVEVMATDRPRPLTWMRSNPIYVRAADRAAQLPVRPPSTSSTSLFDGRSVDGWRVEYDATSLAALDVAPSIGGSELRLRYGLSGGAAANQFAGLVFDAPKGIGTADRLALTVRAEQPMRLSVQLRAGEKARWQRSVYVDTTARERTVFFDDLTPIGGTETWKPPPNDVRSILFVIDTTHTKPGSSGRVWIKSAALQK